MIFRIREFFKKIGLDLTIAYTILTRLIQAGGGVISIIFIAKFLSVDEQGYYYTFISILAIQLFFELGLSGIITQYAAHEFAHLKWTENNQLEGDAYYKSRLASLLQFCVKWFAIISVIFFFILLVVGFIFFTKFNKTDIKWQSPWIILSLSTALNLFIDPLLAFFDGIGKIQDMSKIRLLQKSSYILFLFVFFLMGYKLYSSALASVLSILINYAQVLFSDRIKLLKAIWKNAGEWKLNYMSEIFPYQWRIALSWMCGYFIFQLFNPVLFATEGPKVAGQMGMTLQAFNGVCSLTMSWIVTKVPLFSQYIARKEYKLLDSVFNKTLLFLVLANAVMLGTFDVGVWLLKFYHVSFADRFLPVYPTVLFSIACFFNQIIFSWATYLRCHKKEPFLMQQVTSAVLVSLSTFFLGKSFGLMGIIWGYGILVIFVSFTWSYFLFVNKKKEWHYDAAV